MWIQILATPTKNGDCIGQLLFSKTNKQFSPKLIDRFNTIPVKIRAGFGNAKEPRYQKWPWWSRTKWKNLLCNFKTDHKARLIKTVCSWHKDRHTDNWNRIETPEVNSHIHEQLVSNKCTKAIQWGQIIFNKGAETTGHPCKKINLDLLHFVPKLTKTKS